MDQGDDLSSLESFEISSEDENSVLEDQHVDDSKSFRSEIQMTNPRPIVKPSREEKIQIAFELPQIEAYQGGIFYFLIPKFIL